MNILLAVLLGGFFGFALYMAEATVPSKILKMLRLEDLSLAKIILFAIGLSSVMLSLSAMIGIFDLSHLSVKAMNLGVIIGGLLFGIGFSAAGTCPGTCVGAIGGIRGIKKALSAVFGALLGAFTFSMTYGYFNKIGLFDTLNYGKITLFSISSKYPSVFKTGFLGLLIVGILFMVFSYVIPMKIRD